VQQAKPDIRIIGVPMDLGQSRRGSIWVPVPCAMPACNTAWKIWDYTVYDEGNIAVPNPEEAVAGLGRRRRAVAGVCQEIYERTKPFVDQEDFVIFMGGDHSISIGSVTAVSQPGPIGVIWVDAHGDFNTPETSPTGNIHGMPLAALVGRGAPELTGIGYEGRKVHEVHIVQIGIRSLDTQERTAQTERHPRLHHAPRG
jgi:arginase